MLFSDGTRTALVISSLLTLFPIGIISLVFWILVSTQLHCCCHWKRCFEHFLEKCIYLSRLINYLLTQKLTHPLNSPIPSACSSIHPSIHPSSFLGIVITDAKLNLFFFSCRHEGLGQWDARRGKQKTFTRPKTWL